MNIVRRFFSNQPQVEEEQVSEEHEPTQEELANYQLGFRIGYPFIDEPPVTVPHADNPDFQRGLQAGSRAFQASGGVAKIHYEAQELED